MYNFWVFILHVKQLWSKKVNFYSLRYKLAVHFAKSVLLHFSCAFYYQLSDSAGDKYPVLFSSTVIVIHTHARMHAHTHTHRPPVELCCIVCKQEVKHSAWALWIQYRFILHPQTVLPTPEKYTLNANLSPLMHICISQSFLGCKFPGNTMLETLFKYEQQYDNFMLATDTLAFVRFCTSRGSVARNDVQIGTSCHTNIQCRLIRHLEQFYRWAVLVRSPQSS